MSKISGIFIAATLVLMSLTVQAQKAWDYEWADHNIVFTLTSDFKVTANDGDEFSASGDGMEFSIFPFNDEEVDKSDITAYTIEIAKSVELEELDDVDVIQMNGLEGAYVEGYKDGARLVVLGFIDPESDTNFFAIIAFADDDKEAENEAIRIIKSFRKKK